MDKPHRGLDEVLDEASRASDEVREREWLGPLASFGREAIEPMRRCVEGRDLAMARFALTVLEMIASEGEVEAVDDALARDPDRVPIPAIALVGATLARIRSRARAGSVHLPRGARIGRGWLPVFHVVTAETQEGPGGPVVLYDCGWFFGRDWIDKRGGIRPPRYEQICWRCASGAGGGIDPTGSVADIEGESTWALRNSWHRVLGPVRSVVGVGQVLFSSCGRWFSAPGRQTWSGSTPADGNACRTCLQRLGGTPDALSLETPGHLEDAAWDN